LSKAAPLIDGDGFLLHTSTATAKTMGLLLLLITPFISGFALQTEAKHEYYVGVAEAEWVHEELRISALFFEDDLARASGLSSSSWGTPQADSALARYFTEHLRFEKPGYPRFEWIGHQMEGEQIRCFLRCELSGPSVLSAPLRFDVLMDSHPSQKNLLHLSVAGRRKSWYFNNHQRVQKLEKP
jgi:hypothetical protein